MSGLALKVRWEEDHIFWLSITSRVSSEMLWTRKTLGHELIGYLFSGDGGDMIQLEFFTSTVPAVTEFVPLHDIPYIFLSPDSQPYLSVEEFLASPDQQRDLSTFVPDTSFP